MNGRRPETTKESGFTLVELLVVIGIIVVMSAVTLPNIFGYLRGARIRTAQDQVYNAINKARLKAITSNTQFGVSFIVESASAYWVHVEDPTIATSGAAGTVGRQALVTASPNLNFSTRYVLDSKVKIAIAANSCPGVSAAGNQASLRFDRYGVRFFPGTSPTISDPAVVALGGTPTTANGIVRTDSSAEATICLVDSDTGLYRKIIISPGGRVKKG